MPRGYRHPPAEAKPRYENGLNVEYGPGDFGTSQVFVQLLGQVAACQYPLNLGRPNAKYNGESKPYVLV